MKFFDLQKLPNVKSIDSNSQLSPLNDASVTIFLKNGYRLISEKSILGHRIDLEPVDSTTLPAYHAMIYANINSPDSCWQTPLHEKTVGNCVKSLGRTAFENELLKLVGKEIWHYLAQRHAVLLMGVTHTNQSSKMCRA